MKLSLWLCLYLTLSVLVCSEATLLANSVSSLPSKCPDPEKSALLQFKSNFRIDCSVSADPYGVYAPAAKMKSWIDGQNADCCSWEGVECDKDTGHVIGLDLTCSCLFGSFPSNTSLFSLGHLRKLRLAYNDFNLSHIPSKLGQLQKLQVLDLLDSSFSGQIPQEISQLFELSSLVLGDYTVGGISNLKFEDFSLGKFVQNLTHLQQLYLMNVDVSSTVPITLANLTSLRTITLMYCSLSGELPSNLFHLPNLESLNLGGNLDLVGSLPVFPWHSPLEQMYLFSTSLSGEMPPSIGRLASLESFEIGFAQLSGSIPSSLGNLTKLINLDLSKNMFSGFIPPSISNLTNLRELYLTKLAVVPEPFISQLPKLHKLESLGLSGMSIGTNLPSFLANRTTLTRLDLSNIQGVGPLPQWLENLTRLTDLNLFGNNLIGPIPPWFSHLTNLRSLDLSQNNLIGNFKVFSNFAHLQVLELSGVSLSFPQNYMTNSSLKNLQVLGLSSCNLTEFPEFLRHQNGLQHLDLSQNHISGSIPQWFVNLTRGSLSILHLSANNLTGFEQPITVLPWKNLKGFDIRSNKFKGSLPAPSASLKVYDVSNNQFSGGIPKDFCVGLSLVKLDLSNNSLIGRIPDCIANQLGEYLQLLNLRGNQFHGHIPPNFPTSCKMKMINLSENRLEGTLPRSLVNCTMLEVLDIGQNLVNDTFPSWLQSMPKLQVLVLRNNKFHESITDGKSVLCFQGLRILDISNNFLTGNLPIGFFQNWQKLMVTRENQYDSSHSKITYFFTKSEYLDEQEMNSTSLTRGLEFEHWDCRNILVQEGQLCRPTWFYPAKVQSKSNGRKRKIKGESLLGYVETYEYTITITNKRTETLYPKVLDVFKVLDFSNNMFSGTIPDIIGTLTGLQALNLSNNNLEGMIPPSLAKMTDLESLDLSRNMLSGAIPQQLSQLTSLEVFDISYNRLKGFVPQGSQFDTFDTSSYKGNLGLCGRPLPNQCGKTDVPQKSQTTSDEHIKDTEGLDWFIRSVGCLGGFIIGYIVGKLYITDRYHEWFMETFQRKPKTNVRRAVKHRR